MPLDNYEFSLRSISIDRKGVVSIKDEKHHKALSTMLKTVNAETLMADNGVCGANCPET